ncbi:hypothetical protein [Methanobrevibacter cuticularis]|nr:hypothetical protein [Methanobrevibacter cuticularis]
MKPEITINNIQRNNRDFLEFLREIIGLTRDEDPKKSLKIDLQSL